MKTLQDVRPFDSAKTMSAELADQLCERIRNNRLAPGDRLGTEADLADQFGVSRTVVREAIGSLRGLGVVTGRQGLGLCVGEGDNFSSVLRKALVPQVASPEGWRELQQLRAVIEIGSIALAVEMITAEEIVRLQRGVGGGVSLARDPRELTILDVVNAVDPIRRINTCPLDLKSHGTKLCALHRRMDNALMAMEDAFRSTTLAELLEDPNPSVPLRG